MVLEQAGVKPEELDALVLVGGSTLMPQVPQMIEKLTGKQPYREISPHTAVAQGAAIHAAILEAQHRGESTELAEKVRKMLDAIKQENVNSHGLGIALTNPKTQRRTNYVMIPRNTPLPVEIKQVFRTNHENQEKITIRVLEGDAPDPTACSRLGKCHITDLPPKLPKGAKVEVTYSFDAAGRIAVKARELTAGKEAAIEIERRGRLNEKQVDAYTKLAKNYKVE